MYIHKKCSLFLLLFSMLLSACEEDVQLESLELAVLEGFLYAGSPVDDIHISRMIPFGSDSTVNFALNDLAVILSNGVQEYPLSPSAGDSGYYHYQGNELLIQSGERYQLSFSFNGEEIVAETLVPPSPTGLGLSASSIAVQQLDFNSGFGGGRPNFQEIDPLEITWDNPNQSSYYVLIENIESNPEDIIVGELPFGRPNFNFVTEPTEAANLFLQPRTLEQFGTHRIVLFKVNQEYVDLYENASQDSRNLNEPLTNVINGLGIFTSFSSDTLYLEVNKL